MAADASKTSEAKTFESVEDLLEEFDNDEPAACSCGYLAICVVLPAFAGALMGFVWSGYTLHVRDMNWSLPLAGIAVSGGSFMRLIMQQVLFSVGLWTAVITAAMQGTMALLGIIYPEEAAIVIAQVGCIPAADLTVAIEAIAFETYSGSEALCSQAQASILSTFTLAYAASVTLGGLIYDYGGWQGMSTFHAVCAIGQFAIVAVHPAIRKSFWDFIHREEDESDDDVIPNAQRQSVVPSQPSRPSQLAGVVALPGVVEEDQEDPEPAETEVKSRQQRKAKERKSKSAENRSSLGQYLAFRTSVRSTVFKRGGSVKSTTSGAPRTTTTSAATHRRTTVREFRARWGQNPRASGASAKSSGTKFTMKTAMTNLSMLSTLPAANVQYHYGATHSLRPYVRRSNDDKLMWEGQSNTDSVAVKDQTVQDQKGLPRDLYFVSFMIALCSFNNSLAYAIEWNTFALFFKERHNWTSAVWAGVCQTSGDLVAGLIMALSRQNGRVNVEELSGIRWLWHAITGQPYDIALFAFLWAILSGGLCVPWLPAAIFSQVVMGTLYVFATKAVTDMNLFFSLGKPSVFLQMQVQCRNANAAGGFVTGFIAFILYDVDPLLPFVVGAVNALLICITIMIGFYCRIGFGHDIEQAEARRSAALGLSRVESWRNTKAPS